MIRRRLSWIVLVMVLLVGAMPLRASTVPVIQGRVVGLELCEQAVCGAAIFTAVFGGQVGSNPRALGTIFVTVNHEVPLPPPNSSVNITGGLWQLQLLSGKKFAGILTGGSLTNHEGDGTFIVIADMLRLTNGSPDGTLTFEGTLSHNTFPPTIIGQILQEPSE
jgi:hypothetical protein